MTQINEPHKITGRGKTNLFNWVLQELLARGDEVTEVLIVEEELARTFEPGNTGIGRRILLDAITMPADQVAIEQRAAIHGVTAYLYRRLAPAVTGEQVDAVLTQLERIRDALVAQYPDGIDRDLLAHDPRAYGYRVTLHAARRTADREALRIALLHFELALTQLAEGRPAHRGLRKAAEALGV